MQHKRIVYLHCCKAAAASVLRIGEPGDVGSAGRTAEYPGPGQSSGRLCACLPTGAQRAFQIVEPVVEIVPASLLGGDVLDQQRLFG
jgi:hypothetical protein